MDDKETLTGYDSHSMSLNENGIMVFMSPVTSDTVRPVIEWILHENHVRKRRQKELLLLVCSNGGNLEDAFALIDVMKSSRVPIKTVGLGSIASSGLLIFIAGAPGRRVLTPNTSILSHQFSWGSHGKVHELFATMKEFELVHQRMIQHYRDCTGLDDEKIAQILLPPQDVYLSANEALEFGICDHVANLDGK